MAPRGALVVMGVSGAGKTTLAQLLSTRLQGAFVEGDTLHDARCIAKMQAGQPLTDADRWPWLDRIGLALREATEQHGSAVAACSALRRVYRERLQAALTAPLRFVSLVVPPEELGSRLQRRNGHFMPATLLASQLATLEMPGSDEAALILDARASPAALCDQVMAWLQRGNAYSE